MHNDEITHRFTFHPPSGDADVEQYTRFRAYAKGFAEMLNAQLPENREKSLAVTKVEEALMWANASYARGER